MTTLLNKNQTVGDSASKTDVGVLADVAALLRERGVSPTAQRVLIAAEFLLEPVHLCAEEIVESVCLSDRTVSRATVYNTLKCFVEHGLIRQVNVGADRVFYDSNVTPHHHIFDPESGNLTDVETSRVNIVGLPRLPEGREVESVEIVIRLKPPRE
ncbi:MAG: transcriptional repressor [marine bacterium B5-7]|nr:MAG: transcriptional repressor [marine bacterium B5-7]